MAADEFVLDTPHVRTFITDVRTAIADGSSPADAIERIRPRFADLLADPNWLPAVYQEAAPESGMGGGIGQWALYRADDGSLSLFSLVVPSGSETPVHDHLAWGLVGLYRGTQDEEIFARENGDLRLSERRALGPGDFYALIPPQDDIHPRAHHVAADVGLDPPAHERHRLRVAARLRPGLGRGAPVPVGLRERRLPLSQPTARDL